MADVVYFNAELLNTSASDNLVCEVNDVRAQPIIQRPEDWDMSIIRWNLTTSTIPPCSVDMTGVIDGLGAQTKCVVSLSRGVDNFSSYVYLPLQEANGEFYSYVEFIRAVNEALGRAFSMISSPSSSSQPYFSYSPVTQLISLYYQDTYNTAPTPIKIYLNRLLYRYFVNIPANLMPIPNQEFQLDTSSICSVLIPPASNRYGFPNAINLLTGNVLQLSQQYDSMSQWGNCKTIYITTSSIPIVAENLTTNPTGENQSFGSSTSAIITDFDVSSISPLDAVSTLEYLPQAQYRMVSLRGLEPLTRINLKVFWTNYKGKAFPLSLPPNGYFSAKICFMKKHSAVHRITTYN